MSEGTTATRMGKLKFTRFRHLYMLLGVPLVVLFYVLIEPKTGIIQDLPFGASTIILIAELLKAMWYVAFLHMSRVALFDYIDLSVLFEKAEQSPTGAGLAILGIMLSMVAVAIAIAAAVLSN